jgi:hypothetical protein
MVELQDKAEGEEQWEKGEGFTAYSKKKEIYYYITRPCLIASIN